MWKSLARSLVTCLIHDRWLCEKPWMNTISGPLGLPQSCAAMVRPSGVFTDTALNFFSCALAGAVIAASRSAATEMPARRRHDDARIMCGPPENLLRVMRLYGDRSVHRADQRCKNEQLLERT